MKTSQFTKTFLTLLLMLVLAASTAAPAFASGEGPVTGSFQTSVAPAISLLGVFTNSLLTTAATALTPQQTYYVAVKVTDNDGIGDLSDLTLKLWYDSLGSSYSEAVFDAKTSAEPHTLEIIKWTKGAPTPVSSVLTGWTSVNEGDSSWSLVSSTVPTTSQLADNTYTQSQFVFAIKIGKVARETEGSGKWQIAAHVHDSANYNHYLAYSASSTYGLPMNWYGEISVPSNTSVSWGNVDPGLAFSALAAKKDLNASLVYIANGDYDQAAKSDATWATSGAKTVALANIPAADQFALRAASIAPTGDVTAEGNSYLLTTTPTAFKTEMGGTLEKGKTELTNVLYLSLGSSITNPGTYTGKITYVIQNNTPAQ